MQGYLKIRFVWHWYKKTSKELNGAFSVFDSLLFAIQKLSEKYDVEILCLSKIGQGKYFTKQQQIKYVFFKTKNEIISYLQKNEPDVVFLNHHSDDYRLFLKKINALSALKIIYYSSPIKLNGLDFLRFLKRNGLGAENINKEHNNINYHIVHHEYQKKQLEKFFGIIANQIFVAPKTADLNVFKPIALRKKWDCVYPGRCREGYWKRPKLAIKACDILDKSLVMPGARLLNQYNNVTVLDRWISSQELNIIYNQSRCLLVTSNYIEMGPRIIPEAAACNIPIVCCSDSLAAVSHVRRIGGFIAKPNPRDIAKKIQLATCTICNSREQLLNLGYTRDLVFKTIESILKTVFNKNKKRN